MKVTLFFISLLKIFSFAYSAQILAILPTPSPNHEAVFRGYLQDLSSIGHHLTIITTNEFKTLNSNRNVTQIVLSDSYKVMRKKINAISFSRSPDESATIDASLIVLKAYLQFQLKCPEVTKLIENEHKKTFDVIVLEHSVNHPYLAFSEVYDAPIIAISTSEASNDIHQSFGNVFNPLIHANSIFSFVHDRDMTFHERWQSLKLYVKMKLFTRPKYRKVYNELINEHFPSVEKNVDELEENMRLLLLNTSPVMGYSRAMLPNAIQIGSMHIEPPKRIKSDIIQKFLDDSVEGVVVVNLGNLIQSKDLSLDLKLTLMTTIQKSSLRFVWKYEDSDLDDKLSNLLTVKRIHQQSDVLAHPNVKLFITHGGKLSVEEAIDRAVPMIVIPSTAQETSNALRLEKRSVALHLDLCKVTGNNLGDAIHNVTNNGTVYRNIATLRTMINDRPMSGREAAVWWTEYIIRHRKNAIFDYPGKHVPFYIRYGLDFIVVAVITFLLTWFGLRFLFRRIVAREAAKLEKLKTN